jgi:3-methyladenine DNA glycosylase/8-oxoguanine DNA glycosylase
MAPKNRSQAIAALSRQHRVLKKLARVHGANGFEHRREPFIALARSIIGQQLCVRAA